MLLQYSTFPDAREADAGDCTELKEPVLRAQGRSPGGENPAARVPTPKHWGGPTRTSDESPLTRMSPRASGCSVLLRRWEEVFRGLLVCISDFEEFEAVLREPERSKVSAGFCCCLSQDVSIGGIHSDNQTCDRNKETRALGQKY